MISDRGHIRSLLDDLTTAWACGAWGALRPDFAPDARLISAQHGARSGAGEIVDALRQDRFAHRVSNHYIGIQRDDAATSLYLFGLMEDGGAPLFLFGMTLILRLRRSPAGWQITELRMEAMWSKGSPRLVPHWLQVPGDRGWQPGDPSPVIVSELHAPWHILPDAPVPDALEDALPELYARYAFAVDQNDIGLLVSAYAEDVSGGFAPLGNFEGRDTVIGQLKSFRHLAPFWQHFAEVVAIEDEEDGQHARMIVGRIIPERPVDRTGAPLYGAHCQLRVRRDGRRWRICWSDYRPGWFTSDWTCRGLVPLL
ncbi:hypothetical protein AQS8620_02402 [Aquimixticola soesokkakensis]|uniref:SnoaL-like domain-containing protein n=1 Tax=Aquimixticola soesokkakensis TaxID=1519096 RepID=A0A1Y5T2G4_9RHOB|nr:nuclear transport factor 2 family protein [Aquimixticola soesokkakensis]SLN54370.1 hypothetical protein AQS8620_02402 [Aquimixticola soesokkakensis]